MSDPAITTVPAKRPTVRILENQLVSAEYKRVEYLFQAPLWAVPEDFLEPETYAHLMSKLRVNDVITVMAEDRTWRCEVLVIDVEGQRISLAMLNKHDFEKPAGKEYDEYEVAWGTPVLKYRVIRKSDRHIMVDKIPTKSEGFAWIEKNVLKQAA